MRILTGAICPCLFVVRFAIMKLPLRVGIPTQTGSRFTWNEAPL